MSLLIAFWTNKTFIFRKHDWSPDAVLREGLLVVGSYLQFGVAGIGLMPVLMAMGVTQSVLGIPGLAAKFLAECTTLILSYILSKHAVFRN